MNDVIAAARVLLDAIEPSTCAEVGTLKQALLDLDQEEARKP